MNTINNTKFTVGQRAKIINNDKDKEDKGILIGQTGSLTHPFASGCNDAGWLGFHCDHYTAYGYTFNVHESEIELIED